MFRCFNCSEWFEEPDCEQICLEDYYGVGSLFPDRHYGTINVCPRCGSEDFDEEYEEELA